MQRINLCFNFRIIYIHFVLVVPILDEYVSFLIIPSVSVCPYPLEHYSVYKNGGRCEGNSSNFKVGNWFLKSKPLYLGLLCFQFFLKEEISKLIKYIDVQKSA